MNTNQKDRALFTPDRSRIDHYRLATGLQVISARMQFLSVAGRELRVAARKQTSFRLRMLIAGLALCITGFSLWFTTLFGSRPATGDQLFQTLRWVAFICACLVGPALTADSITEERDNGTLGLLFLTNLPPISISLGKLAGHGLLALYSIVSIVPVMTLPVLLGGADPVSLAKTALVLFSTLILSLLIGMFASTVCRKSWRAAGLALVVLGVLVFGIPLASFLLRVNNPQSALSAALELFSPSFALSMAGAGAGAATLSSNRLWLALGIQAIAALAFFALITFLLRRVWIEGKSAGKAMGFLYKWRTLQYGGAETRRALRLCLLQMNPILWLSCRERFAPMGFAAVLLALAFVIAWEGQYFQVNIGPNRNDFLGPMVAWIVGMPVLYLCFCFRLAAAASARFAADRKAGALELILCTPLKTWEIIRGQWLGLLRRLWGAALLLLALHVFVLHYIIEAIRLEAHLGFFGLSEVLAGTVRHIAGSGWIPNEIAPYYIACLAVLTAAILIVILWIALGWLGMALSLKLRREILAPWVSLFLLAAPPIPMFVIMVALTDDKELFALDLFMGLLRMGASGFFIVLINALIWMLLARRWTYAKLRPTPQAA